MNADEYQQAAARTLIDAPGFTLSLDDEDTAAQAVFIGANTGKIAEYVKKGLFHQRGIDYAALEEMHGWGNMTVTNDGELMDADDTMLVWNVLGLVGEAGEVAGLVEQYTYDGRDIPTDLLKKELGDVLWYVAALATRAGLRLSDIMSTNIDKLTTRYPHGYTDAASAARVDVGVSPLVKAYDALEKHQANLDYIGKLDRISGVERQRLYEGTWDGVYTACNRCAGDRDDNSRPCIHGCGRFFCGVCASNGYSVCHMCSPVDVGDNPYLPAGYAERLPRQFVGGTTPPLTLSIKRPEGWPDATIAPVEITAHSGCIGAISLQTEQHTCVCGKSGCSNCAEGTPVSILSLNPDATTVPTMPRCGYCGVCTGLVEIADTRKCYNCGSPICENCWGNSNVICKACSAGYAATSPPPFAAMTNPALADEGLRCGGCGNLNADEALTCICACGCTEVLCVTCANQRRFCYDCSEGADDRELGESYDDIPGGGGRNDE